MQEIIDAHTHVFPEHIAEKTVMQLSVTSEIPYNFDGTVNGLVMLLDLSSISMAVTAPIATKPEQVERINRWAIANKHPRIINFGAMHPDYTGNIYNELSFIKENGFKGVKLHPDYQLFYPDEKRAFPIYEACADLGLPILFHAGDDTGVTEPGHCLPRLYAKVLRAVPKLAAIFAHLGGFEMWDQAYKYLAGTNAYLDTSLIAGRIDMRRFYDIIAMHDPERILFGSDAPWGNMETQARFIQECDLSDKAKADILANNAKRLFGLA